MLKNYKAIMVMWWFCLLTLCLYPALGLAVVAVQTEIVSGIIVQKSEDHAVKLDNGEIYQPSRNDIDLTVNIGEPVTLRYVVEEERNVFFEFAPGLNSLTNNNRPPVEKDNRPK